MSPLSVDPNRIFESVGHRRITVCVRFPRIAFLFACVVASPPPCGTVRVENLRFASPGKRLLGRYRRWEPAQYQLRPREWLYSPESRTTVADGAF